MDDNHKLMEMIGVLFYGLPLLERNWENLYKYFKYIKGIKNLQNYYIIIKTPLLSGADISAYNIDGYNTFSIFVNYTRSKYTDKDFWISSCIIAGSGLAEVVFKDHKEYYLDNHLIRDMDMVDKFLYTINSKIVDGKILPTIYTMINSEKHHPRISFCPKHEISDWELKY